MDDLMLDVIYNGGAGHMTVYLPAFLERQGVIVIKKLIKLIETSDTPEEMQKLMTYVKADNSSIDGKIKVAADSAADENAKVKELYLELDRFISYRNRKGCRKNSEPYKALSGKIKELREQIRLHKAVFRNSKAELNQLRRLKGKFRKIIEFKGD